MMNKILTTTFIMSTLLFTAANAEEIISKNNKIERDDKRDYFVANFEAIDINNDGYIVAEEFEVFNEENFDKLDENGNNAITKDEFKKGKKEMLKNAKEGDKKDYKKRYDCPITEIFDKMDKEGRKELTKDEFMNYQNEEFKKMDKNNNEKITLNEYSEYKTQKIEEMKKQKNK